MALLFLLRRSLLEAFLYKTTNLLNNRLYVGVRTLRGTGADKTYLGSGKAILAAINKYGSENFKREILYSGTSSDCYELEELLVDVDWVGSDKNYNIALGGMGGNKGEVVNKKTSASHKKLWENKTEEEKQQRRDWLDSIRDPTNIRVRGEAVHNWTGHWITPKGSFVTVRDAAAANGIQR